MSVDSSRFSYGRPQWDMDRGELAAASTEVGDQVASKQDLSALLPNSGACVMPPSSGNVSGSRFMPFSESVGDPRGCVISTEDGIILNAIGRWDVRCMSMTTVSKVAGSGSYGEVRLELFAPDGTFISRKSSRLVLDGIVFSTGTHNVRLDMNVVVDKPGYRVRVYQWKNSLDAIETSSSRDYNELSATYVYNGTPNFGGA